jgi:hypothetical protein
MGLDMHHEQELEATFEHKQFETFRKEQKNNKVKYCKEKLNKTCETCPMPCDYMLDVIEDKKG